MSNTEARLISSKQMAAIAAVVSRFMPYVYLGIAIVSEVIATSALKQANGFSRLGPSLVVAAGYGAAFYCLSLTLRSLPVGIVYAIWSGIGIVLVSLAGFVLYEQALDTPAIIGISLILLGLVVINLFSRSSV